MDPRLRERRIEVARDRGRRRLHRLVAVLVVVALVVGAYGLTRSPLLDVDRIVVSGADRTGAPQVRRASGLRTGDPLLGLDAAGAARRLEALPWVAGASVSKAWGGTVRIVVRERSAVAVVGSGASARLVDATGRVLAPATAQDRDRLPAVAGAVADPGATLGPTQRAVVGVVGDLPAALRAQVDRAWRGRAGVVLVLDDAIVVRWGAAGDSSAKANALSLLLEQADRSTIASIDVTVPGSPAVRRKNGPG
jgi:cell division protein FtsQ